MNSVSNLTTFSIKTIGCKVNQYESEMMRLRLSQNGYRFCESHDQCDFFIVNSCTVTHKADRDTRKSIRYCAKTSPMTKIIVLGCYAETKVDRQTLKALPNVFYVAGNKGKDRIVNILNSVVQKKKEKKISTLSDYSLKDRAFIKIQDGCDNKCSYCKVNLVRGKAKSRNEKEILQEISLLVNKGFNEIVLTGICLGAWGRELAGKKSLTSLLKAILKIDGNFRVRLSSVEPMYVTKPLIDLMSETDKICRHLHIPFQSASDSILKSMNRPYDSDYLLRLASRVKDQVKDVAITGDVIVGFPGETAATFKDTVKCLDKIKPPRLHIFSYSPREGTKAFKMKQTSTQKEVSEFYNTLSRYQEGWKRAFIDRFLGKELMVLIESRKDKKSGLFTGYTDNYIRVLVRGASRGYAGRIARVRLIKAGNGGVISEIAHY